MAATRIMKHAMIAFGLSPSVGETGRVRVVLIFSIWRIQKYAPTGFMFISKTDLNHRIGY